MASSQAFDKVTAASSGTALSLASLRPVRVLRGRFLLISLFSTSEGPVLSPWPLPPLWMIWFSLMASRAHSELISRPDLFFEVQAHTPHCLLDTSTLLLSCPLQSGLYPAASSPSKTSHITPLLCTESLGAPQFTWSKSQDPKMAKRPYTTCPFPHSLTHLLPFPTHFLHSRHTGLLGGCLECSFQISTLIALSPSSGLCPNVTLLPTSPIALIVL